MSFNTHPWTPEEDQMLRDMAPILLTDELAALLNRSRWSINHRASMLKINRRKAPTFGREPTMDWQAGKELCLLMRREWRAV